MSAYAITQFLFAPVIGNLSDKYGRRPVLLTSLTGFGIDYLFLALAPTYGWLFLGRIIAGLTGASFTTGAAYIADISTPETRAKNFGMIGAAFGLGFVIGPAIGGLLVDFGIIAPFYAAAGLCLLNALYGYFVLPESLSKENRRPFEWKRANPFGALKFLQKRPAIGGLALSFFLSTYQPRLFRLTGAFLLFIDLVGQKNLSAYPWQLLASLLGLYKVDLPELSIQGLVMKKVYTLVCLILCGPAIICICNRRLDDVCFYSSLLFRWNCRPSPCRQHWQAMCLPMNRVNYRAL